MLWSQKDLVHMPDLVKAMNAEGKGKKQALDKDSSVEML